MKGAGGMEGMARRVICSSVCVCVFLELKLCCFWVANEEILIDLYIVIMSWGLPKSWVTVGTKSIQFSEGNHVNLH